MFTEWIMKTSAATYSSLALTRFYNSLSHLIFSTSAMRWIFLFCWWENRGSESLINFPKVQSVEALLQNLCHHHSPRYSGVGIDERASAKRLNPRRASVERSLDPEAGISQPLSTAGGGRPWPRWAAAPPEGAQRTHGADWKPTACTAGCCRHLPYGSTRTPGPSSGTRLRPLCVCL